MIMAMIMVGDDDDFIRGLILGSMTGASFCRRSKSSQAWLSFHLFIIIELQLFEKGYESVLN